MKRDNIHLLITLVSGGLNDPLQQSLQQIFPDSTLYEEPGVCVLRAAPGILIQLCGPGAMIPPCLLSSSRPIISYRVNNLLQTVNIARGHGAIILQQATDACTGFSFCYLQFPGKQVAGFFTPG